MAQRLSAQQMGVAKLLYGLARRGGASHQRALEFAAASYAESGLNPRAVNKSSGAAGLFQLLSSGYRSKAQAGGGVFNPRANAGAILGDYLKFWRSHPGAAPGAAASAVERSGEGAGFYASPLALLRGVGAGGGAMPGPGPAPGALPAAPGAPPAPDLGPLRQDALRQLLAGFGGGQMNVTPFLESLKTYRNAQQQAAATPAAPQPFPGAPAAPRAARASGGVRLVGSTQGVKQSLLNAISAAARAQGATQIRVTSGYRSPSHNAAVGGVGRSNHLTGDAVDAEAFVPGRGWVPLGTLLRGVAPRYGLRSGDQPGFYHGGRDPVHVDDAYNQRRR